jgi:transposase
LTERIQALDEQRLAVQPVTDPEARVMKSRKIGYNVQTVVDGKHHLIADVDVVQDASDNQQLYRLARRAKWRLRAEGLEVLADAGYSNGKLLRRCQIHGLEPYLPVQRALNNQGTGEYFDKTRFLYHADGDYFECPAGEQLPRKTLSSKDRLYLYTSEACKGCWLKEQCTAAERRWVTRHFDEEVLTEVAERTDANPMMMRRRKAMVEHPFGTLKRRMDGGRFLLRGIGKVKAEMAVTAYNLTRAINLLGARRLCEALAV